MFKKINYDLNFVIGTPLVPWKVERNEHNAWIEYAKEIKKSFPNANFFAALELDHRTVEEAYGDFLQELSSIDAEYWTYSLNDNQERVTYDNRWIRIEMGRNLIREFAQRSRAVAEPNWGQGADQTGYINHDAILYVDSDMVVNVEIIEKLMEVDRPVVSINVPAYGLKGKVVNKSPRIEEHWNTAGMLWVNSPYFYDLPWYHNNFMNLSDDPTFQYLLDRLYGQTWVRKDINAMHKGQLVPVEERNISDRILPN